MPPRPPARPTTKSASPAQPPVEPSSLHIVHHPDPVLHKKAPHVPPSDAQTRAVANRMLELMRNAEGIGLAAPQVGLSWRMFILHVPEDIEDERLIHSDPPSATPAPRVYIDPQITAYNGPLEPFEEGCLSLPGIRGEVLRPPQVTVTAIDEHGERFTHTAGGLLARCIQHELDHLDGILIINKMTQTSRMKNKKKIKELEEA